MNSYRLSFIKTGRGRTAILICCVLASVAARGQSLDYERLETLFDEPVTMSATGKPERLSDTPATIDIITQADIKRSGARDLATLLRLLPGIATYRGYNGSEAFSIGAILLNGREIYLAAFNQTFLDSIPVELEEIRQIEVVRGPQSALYGFASGDGVINIITFDPAEDAIDFIRLRGGDDARRDGAASVTLSPADGVGVRLTAASDHQHAEGFDAPRALQIAPENQDRRSFNALFSAAMPSGGHANLEVSHSDLSVASTVPEATLMFNGRLQTDAVKADYAVETPIGRIGALASTTAMSVPEADTYLSPSVNLHDHTIDGRLNDLLKLSPNDSVRAEFEAREEDVHSAVSPQPVSTLMTAVSGMWDHRFGPSLSMVNAVRYFHADITQTGPGLTDGDYHSHPMGIGDNSALIWKATDEDSLRGSFARGVALPSQLSFGQFGLTSMSAKGDSLAAGPMLAAWTNSEERATYDHQFHQWGVDARLSLFRQQTQNVISLLPFQLLASATPTCTPPTPRMAAACRALTGSNSLSGSMQGLELEIEHKSKEGLTWGANYAAEILQPHGLLPTDSLVPAIAEREILQKANAHIGYGRGDWSADLRLLYTGPTPSPTLDLLSTVPHVALEQDRAIVELSPRIGWQASDHWMIEASAENLWPYRLNALQRVDSAYFMTLKLSY
jgi:iron complex outermembrane receptor protein